MPGTWWVGRRELDADQRALISLPLDDSVFVVGPPGSGKTNLLLLRANYLFKSDLHNIVVVTFTRALREFIVGGAANYAFPASRIKTCRAWQIDLLKQYGREIDPCDDFEEEQQRLTREVSDLIASEGLSNIYDALLLDEAQDYTPDQIRVFRSLTERLFCVADERQKIYHRPDPMKTIQECIGKAHRLRFHYRNGACICRVADEIAKGWLGYQPLVRTSNYPEATNPSSVDATECASIEAQAASVLARLSAQLRAFPDEPIGILCPTHAALDSVWDVISKSPHAGSACLLRGGEPLPADKRVLAMTFHSAKGLEFRALHLVACEQLARFKNSRRLAFMAVTRAKTSLSVYHTGELPPFFDAALRVLEPPSEPPTLDELFGGRKQ